MKTKFPKNNSHMPKWYIIDAEQKTLGRLATEISGLLRGKKNTFFYPSADQSNFVIVINTNKIKISGKKELQKKYYSSTQRPGNLKQVIFKNLRENFSTRIIEKAVSRMLPKGILGKHYLKKLFLYSDSTILYKKII